MKSVASDHTVPLVGANDPDWFLNHENLAALWRWLDGRGQAPADVAHYLEKPWHWSPEFIDMCAEGQ